MDIYKLFFLAAVFFIFNRATSQNNLRQQDLQKDFDFFQHLFEETNAGLYRHHSKEDIDRIFTVNRKEISDTTSYRDFYNIVWNVVDYTGSLHNNLDYPDSLKEKLAKKKIFFPLPLKYIDGSLIANGDYKEIKVGDRIQSINGIDAQTFAKTVGHYRSTDGYNTTEKYAFIQTKKLADYIYYAYGAQNEFVITYHPSDSITRKIHLPAVDHQTFEKQYGERYIPDYEKEKDTAYYFKMLADGTAYLRVKSFAIGIEGSAAYHTFADSLDQLFKRLKRDKTPNLIVDIRGNGGGIDPNESLLFSYMTERNFKENTSAYTLGYKFPFKKQLVLNGMSVEEQEAAGKERQNNFRNGKYYQNQKFNPEWHPDKNRFSGTIYMLIDPFIASAASHYAAMMKSDRRAIVIGQETGGGYYGHTGHFNIKYRFPHTGLLLSFSVVNLEQDVRELPDQKRGQGVMPDHTVEESLKDYLNNTDLVLEYTLRLIRESHHLRKHPD